MEQCCVYRQTNCERNQFISFQSQANAKGTFYEITQGSLPWTVIVQHLCNLSLDMPRGRRSILIFIRIDEKIGEIMERRTVCFS